MHGRTTGVGRSESNDQRLKSTLCGHSAFCKAAIRRSNADRSALVGNRTPIGRPVSRTKSNRRKNNCVNIVQQHVCHPSFAQTLTAPVFSLCWLRTESHQTPIRIKLAAMLCDRPGGLSHPRETLVPSHVQGVACIHYGYRRDDASPLVAHGLGELSNLYSFPMAQRRRPIVRMVSHQSALLAHRLWPNRHPKHRFTSKGSWLRRM